MNRAEKAEVKREAILAAAKEVFAEHGFAGATIDEIAAKAGVAKGTPYLYFPTKADLFYAVFELWTGECMTASVTAMQGATTARDTIMALALGSVEFMQANREWFPLSLEVWAASSTPVLRDRFTEALQGIYAMYRQETAAIIRQGQEAGEWCEDVDADAMASMLTGAIDGLFVQCWFDPELDATRMTLGFLEVILRGMECDMPGDRK